MRGALQASVAVLLLIPMMAAPAVAYPIEGQLLTNPGFDLDEDGDGIPDGWSTSGERATLQEIVFMGGNNALVSVGDTYVLATQDVTLEPDETYTISFSARGSGGGTAGVLLLHGEDRPVREMPLIWRSPVDEEYTEVGRTFKAPNAVARLYIYNTARKGEVAFDWVSLTKGEATRSYVNTVTFGERDMPDTDPVVREGMMPWGNPLSGGPLRAMISIYVFNTMRDTVELGQRLEMDADVMQGGYVGDLLYSLNGGRIMRTMDEDGYEVYVIASRLDERFEGEVREKVEAGAGLVVVSGFGRLGNYCAKEELEVVGADHPLMRDMPWEFMPAEILSEVRVGQIGEGRVVWLSFPNDVARVWGLLPVQLGHNDWMTREMRYWEHWYGFMARAARYAARGDSGISLVREGEAIRVIGAPAAATVEVTPRHTRELRWGEADLSWPTQSFAAGAPITPVVAEQPPDGPMIFDVVVRDADGGALYWGSVADEAQPGPITELALDREWYEPGGMVRVTVTAAEQPAASVLQAGMVDAWGRTIAEATAPAATETVLELAPAAEQVLTAGHKLFVKLLAQDGHEVDSAWTDVYFPAVANEAPQQDWHVSTWGDGMTTPYTSEQYSRMLLELGFNGKFGSFPYGTTEYPLISGLHSRAGRVFTGSAKIEDGVRTPCLSNPEIVAQYTTEAPEEITQYRQLGPFALNLCDEATLSNRHTRREVCFSEWCQSRYRDWLRGQYGTIAALNESWGTNHASFDGIVGATSEDVRGSANYAPFVDFRTFMTDVWIDGMAGITGAYEQAWPEGRVGHTNTFGAMPTNGNDFWKLCTQTGFEWAQEYSEAIKGNAQKAVFEIWRSFCPEDFPNYGWIGYDHREAAVRYEPWWLAFHDSGGVTYYATNSLSAERSKSWSLVFATQAYTPYSRQVAEEIRPLREGIGKALIDARRADPDVAILWSHPSMLVAWCESTWDLPEPPETAVDDAYGSWYKSAFYFRLALQELQLMYNYVAPEQILAGELDRYRVLFLPMTFAISDELAEALVEWVEDGGTLIADLQFARTDERGSPRDGAMLERLFGVRRAQPEAVYELATLTGPGEQTFDTSAREIVEMLGDAESDASYADGTPAVIFREVGAGRTAYLNGLLPKYDPSVIGMFDEAMREGGVERRVVVDSGDPENPARAWECAEYELGTARIVGLIRDHRLSSDSQTCTVDFGRVAHIYDMRAQEYLGETQTAQLTLLPGEAACLALLPHEVTGVQVVADGPRLRGNILSGGEVSDHVLHVEVAGPDGEVRPAYTRNISASGGAAELVIPLALSDPAGEWSVTVRDVLSGREGSARFEWQPGA